MNLKLITVCMFLALSACATNRATSLNMLEKTADYDGKHYTEGELRSMKGTLMSPSRSKPKVTDVYIHGHEMPTNDYFIGGWIKVVVGHAQWEIEEESSLFKDNKKTK